MISYRETERPVRRRHARANPVWDEIADKLRDGTTLRVEANARQTIQNALARRNLTGRGGLHIWPDNGAFVVWYEPAAQEKGETG